MLNLTPYLHFQGNTERAMRFYQSVIGGEMTILGRYKDVPGGEKLLPEDQEKLMHASLVVNERLTIMATDVLDNMDRDIVPGSNFYICLQADSKTEAERLLAALAASGATVSPLHTTTYGAVSGTCIDQYGMRWMVSC